MDYSRILFESESEKINESLSNLKTIYSPEQQQENFADAVQQPNEIAQGIVKAFFDNENLHC